MSVQFGRWNFDRSVIREDYLAKVSTCLAPYDIDGRKDYSREDLRILYLPFLTTADSAYETQPHVSQSGPVITWDGRLDNRSELLRELGITGLRDKTDVEIVAKAYDQWGNKCLAKLIGDWALSIFLPRSRTLLLAKDFIGTRHLYYTAHSNYVIWSTVLDPLVLFSEKRSSIDREYLAGWLGFYPAPHLTPYCGVCSVPPSSFVLLGEGKTHIERYWNFDPNKKIRYGADSTYQEHFRDLFNESVRRRLRSPHPVLSDLSGGIDSSSVVCVADRLISEGQAHVPRVDTISYYDLHEPHWNELPYISIMEKKRGRTGTHIDIHKQRFVPAEYPKAHFSALPNSGVCLNEAAKQFQVAVRAQGNRVHLSGTGGDEVLGGVPTPLPELANLLVAGNISTFFRQLSRWALAKKRPVLGLATDVLQNFLPFRLFGSSVQESRPQWFTKDFLVGCKAAYQGYDQRTHVFGPLPSFQDAMGSLHMLRRQLGCLPLNNEPLLEKRYPFLDRDLLEFLYAIPREQIVRPYERRSLMRRALAEIVPAEILNRRRKGFIARRPVVEFHANYPELLGLSRNMLSEALGIVDAKRFTQSLQNAKNGQEINLIAILRLLALEKWLRHVHERNAPAFPTVSDPSTELRAKTNHLSPRLDVAP